MKLILAFALSLMALSAAQIPAGAVKSDDGSYHYTDKSGKKWIYRQTPWGVSKAEDKPAEPLPVERYDNVTATDAGDSVHFERPGPFGTYKWNRKKTELSDMEQAVWNRERARAAVQQEN